MEAARLPSRAPWALLLVLLVSACSGAATDPPATPGEVSPTVSTMTAPTTTAPSTDATTNVPADPSTTAQPSTATTTSTLPPLDPPTFESLGGIDTITDFASSTARGIARWEQSVPGVEDMRITSSADGAEQPALWLAPSGEGDRPLLVILHSWSAGYTQHASIPYAMWAEENGWAVIAPQFRGVNDDASAIGSDLAVQDVVDAIDYATSQDGVEEGRVYAVGYSGGGMMSLLLAGRHPDVVTAVAAWGPIHDLVEFYRQSLSLGRRYAGDIRRGCGGDPTDGGSAQEECHRRSPMSYLDAAREQGVPVFIAQGIADSLLSPSHGANAFNQLANPENRLTEDEVDAIGRGSLPDQLSGSVTTETYFSEGDPAPVFARQSDSAWLVFFNAGHDMVYEATLRWFASDLR